MIIIEDRLSNANFDLIFSSPDRTTGCFVMKSSQNSMDIAYFLADFSKTSSLIADLTTVQTFTGIFARRILNKNWKVEIIRYSMLERLLKACPKDDVAALSESLLDQIDAYEHDLVQEPIRNQMRTLLRSYSPTEAPERNL